MPSKTIFNLLLVFALVSLVGGQDKKPDDRALPRQLSENEVQSIIKQTNPRSHVETTLKVSDARLANAMKNIQANEFEIAVTDVDVYASLVIYANDYTRKLPDSQIKDRNHCLKKIEQAIFKQSRNLDTVNRDVPFLVREPIIEKINEVKKIRLRALDDVLGGGKFINSTN
ncbi:MAG: hypothetical protein SF097_11355 [Acidobacteriota bacterium]|nr:hypothetical protein [Acidobacteriota bacterium]